MGRSSGLRLALLAGLLALSACADNRVEGLSPTQGISRQPVSTLEFDLSVGGSVGWRATGLGERDTSEVFVRKLRGRTKGSDDPRDKRSGVGTSTRRESAYHLGLVGLDLDGTRGKPKSIRAGITELTQVAKGTAGVAELAYQSGTFGGETAARGNAGGIYTRLGLRRELGKSFYAAGDYTFSPGDSTRWVPGVRLGFSF